MQPLQYTREQIFKNNRIPLLAEQVEVSKEGVEAHSHQFMELALILQGEGIHNSSQGDQKIGKGDVFVLRPGAWHSFQNCNDLLVFNCCFGSELLQQELSWIRQIPGLNYLLWRGPLTSNAPGLLALKLPDSAMESCQEYLSKISEFVQTKPEQRPEQHKAALLGFLLVFLSEISNSIDLERIQTDAESSLVFPQVVLEGIRLVENNIGQSWTIGDLAVQLHLNPAYLTRLFRKHTGLSPIAYLNHYRAELAARLLVETTKPIAEIANEVGWPDQNYFARCFKAHFGVSGTLYRARYRHHLKL